MKEKDRKINKKRYTKLLRQIKLEIQIIALKGKNK